MPPRRHRRGDDDQRDSRCRSRRRLRHCLRVVRTKKKEKDDPTPAWYVSVCLSLSLSQLAVQSYLR